MARNVNLLCDVELAWAAGLFDGEGSVYVTEKQVAGQRYLCVHLQVCQSGYECPEVLIRFQFAVESLYGILGPNKPSKGSHARKPTWAFRASSREEASRIMNLLLPYLSKEKRKQWDGVLKKLEIYDLELSKRKRRVLSGKK